MSNDQNIKNFDKFYDHKNREIELTGLKPLLPFDNFMKQTYSSGRIIVRNLCSVFTDNDGILSKIVLSCIVIKQETKINPDIFCYRVSITYDSEFQVTSVNYKKSKSNKDIFEINKPKEMLCPLDDEFRILEVFLNDDKDITKELFPEWYVDGAYRLNASDFENNLITLRMLTI